MGGLWVVALLPAAAAAPAVTWQRFADAHGSSVEAPVSLLHRTPDPHGLAFTSRDGRSRASLDTVTEMRPGFPGNDPAGDMASMRGDCDHWPPAYQVVKPRLAAFSCPLNGAITYYIAKYGRGGSATLRISYPVEENARWKPVVARMAASLTQQERTGGRYAP